MIKPIAVALILLTPSAYADVDLPAELKDKIEAVGMVIPPFLTGQISRIR